MQEKFQTLYSTADTSVDLCGILVMNRALVVVEMWIGVVGERIRIYLNYSYSTN